MQIDERNRGLRSAPSTPIAAIVPNSSASTLWSNAQRNRLTVPPCEMLLPASTMASTPTTNAIGFGATRIARAVVVAAIPTWTSTATIIIASGRSFSRPATAARLPMIR